MPRALLSVLTLIAVCALPGASALAAPATPTFGPKTAFDANTSGGLPKSVTKANFNNDSYDDAAITSSFVYRDLSDGTLHTTVSTYEYVGGPSGLTRLGYNESASSGLDGYIDSTGDVNGDGTDEVIRVNLITSLGSSSLSAFDFNAAGAGLEATYGAIVPGVVTDLVVGNFLPADDALEIAVRAGSGQVEIYDVSAGALVHTRTIAAPAGRVGVLDYDTATIPADNADDILVGATSPGPVALYLNNAGIFTARADLMAATVEPGATVGFGRGDLDGDGRNDFATTAQTAAGAASFAGALSGAFGSYVHASDSAVSTASHPALAPVVGSFLAGARDDSVVFADAANVLSYATGASTPTRTSFALDGAVRSSAAVDVNGDGRDDLVTIGADGSAQTYPSVIANTQIISGPSPLTNSANASLTFQSDVSSATFECSLDAAAYTACASPKLLGGLSDVQHTFSVRAIDASGTDATPATHAWTVDTTAPQTTIATTPAGLTNSAAASFEFSSNEAGATFQCSRDNAAYTTCVSPKAYTGIAGGPHTFAVKAIDSAGNSDGTPDSYAWTVDLVAPQTTIDSGPDPAMSSTTATVAFSSDDPGATFQCALDDEPFAACASPKTYAGLDPQVEHNVFVRAVDAAGNVDQTVAYRYWYIDQSAPDTSITAAPDALTTSHAAQFAFSSPTIGDATFECRLDAGEFAGCDSPENLSDLADGEHTFDVRAINTQAVVDDTPATYTWTVDSTAPATILTVKPADPATTTAATFEFSSDDAGATFECKLDSGAFEACTSPTSYSGLSQGSHTFELRAGDAIGNTAATVSHTWVVDSVRPTTTITDIPGSPWNSSDVTLAFSSDDAGATFGCKLDDGAFAPCASPKDYTGLSDGRHDFEVRAVDSAGNVGDADAEVVDIDTTGADTTIDAGPSGATSATAATFAFSTTEPAGTFGRFECRLDGAVFAICDSPHAYGALSDGEHTFEVRAIDDLGNVGEAAASSWTVDTAAPAESAIVAGPQGTISSKTATFEFTGEAGATFECSLDGAAFAPCTSPMTYDGLADGPHTFTLRQIDSAGNAGAPSTTAFAVAQPPLTPPPPPSTTPPPPPPPATSTVTPDASSLRVVVARRGTLRKAAVPIGCRLDAGTLASCTVRAYASDVRVGAGAQTFTGGRLGAVRVKLTARGLRLVRRVGGVRLSYRATATTAAARTLRGRATSMVLPLRATAVSTDGVFGAGSARLTTTGKRYVNALAADLGDAERVVCTGHTDSVGSAASNRRLGFARAKSVCSQLRNAGVRAELHSRSAGERQPRAHNGTARGRALNRRVELTVSYR
jgi:outer membrane protein OmpA-like peptidoglycan-associated protein